MSPDVHTLTGAYALDALDPEEREAFEAHLAECPDCASEVAELRATAAKLGAAVAMTPPDELRHWVMAEIGRTRQESPGGLRPVGDEGSARGRSWTVRISVAAAAVCLLAAGALAGVAISADEQLQSAQDALGQLRGELSQDAARYQPLAEVLGAPDVRVAAGTADGGTATLLTSARLGRSVLVSQHMPVQPVDRTYQAWGIGPAGFTSLGVLGPGSGGVLAVTDLGSAKEVGITIEPAGGSAQPTSAPIMHFDVPA